MNNLPPHLITYPRSGSHFFDKLVYEKTKLHIPRSHNVNWMLDKNNKKIKRIITIARDPRDSVHSLIALEMILLPFAVPLKDKMITEYILLYDFLYKKADYVIDFNDLVEYPDLVMKRLLGLLRIDKENSHIFNTNIDYDSKAYRKSSKKLVDYGTTDLDKLNIDSCYYYYNRLLEKKIIIQPIT
jgi:hypothetical protein